MKYWLLLFGVMLATGFGLAFVIRLVRDGDFYIAEFSVSLIGIIIILIGFFVKGKDKALDS